MTHRTLMAATLVAALLPAGRAEASGPGKSFDAVMRRLLDEYQKIHASLAADSMRDVALSARALEKVCGELQGAPAAGQHAARYRELPAKIKGAAQRLGQARTLPAARQAMKELSRPLALWASLARPADVNVVYCSMAKASWLQRDAAIRNPYYGAQMLHCGEVVSGPAKGQAGGHMAK